MSHDEDEDVEPNFKAGADEDELGEPLDMPDEIFEYDEEDPDKDK